MFEVLDASVLAAIIVVVVLLGVKGYGVSASLNGFFLASRSLGAWVLAFSIMATYFSAASFLGGGGATYLYNLGFGAWLTAWHVIGVVLTWILVAERLFKYASKTGVVSVPDFIERRYQSKSAKILAATVIMFLFTLYLTSVYKGGAIIMATVLNTSFETGLLLLTLPILVYVGVGGLKATALNNLVLGILMLSASILTFSYIMVSVGGPLNGMEMLGRMKVANDIPGALWLKLDGMGPPPAINVGMVPTLIMSTTFSISMAQLALPTLLMQFHAARNIKAINGGKIIGPIVVGLYALLTFSLGAFCHLILDAKIGSEGVLALIKDSDWVIPKTVELIVPTGIRGLILAAPVAASMSTLAVTFLVLSAALVKDVVYTVKPNLDERKLVLTARIAPAAFAMIAAFLTLIQSGIIVEIVGAAFGTIFACFVGPVTIGLYWKGATKAGSVASMISGLLTGLLWYLCLYKAKWAPPILAWTSPVIPALAVSIPTFFIVSLLTEKPPPETLEPLH
ncbi:MAG: hypothetical protein QFX33_01840 [Candidatus Nezhaarchaeota archaeon]|nr:hypothetical protein [Candidatus Nezhaarchaeota archaeon]